MTTEMKGPIVPEGLNLGELERRANEARARYLQGREVSDGEPSKGIIAVVAFETACVECGAPVQSTRVERGGRPAGPSARTCDGCLNKAHATPKPLDVHTALDDLGFNVRRHGRLTLRDFDGVPCRRGGGESLDVTGVVSGWLTAVLHARPWDEVESLYLTGPTGTGKSQLMCSMARYLLDASYPTRSIVFVRARAWINEIQDRYGTGTVDAYVDRFRKAGVLFIDDAGCEKLSLDAFRYVEDVLDAREGHPTVWSSNDGPDALVDYWAAGTGARTDRFRSRLANFRFVEFEGKDRRFER